MFLLERIDVLALLGLFTQTGVTWLFLVVFLVLWRASRRQGFERTWALAFLALAVALTAVSVRFFYSFDERSFPVEVWGEGRPLPRLCYSVYLVGKAFFAVLLLRGTAELAGRPLTQLCRTVAPGLALLLGLVPLFTGDIHVLLLLQVPLMITCCLLAWRRLGRSPQADTVGVRIVRFTLAGMAVLWTVHGFSAAWAFVGPSELAHVLRALNSHLDLAFEVPLGAGLIVVQLEDARRRLRAAQAEQAQLRQEIERDERLRALGTLVSGVAHELNNPLTAILGFSEAPGVGGQTLRALRVIHEQAERCRGIVRSLSALAGGHAHEPRPNDPAAMVGRVARGFQPQLAASGVALRIDVGTTAWVLADAFGIEQVLTNLLSNAIQASPRGGTIEVRLGEAGGRVVVEVEDEGPGIPEETRARIFEPFFSTKPSGSGTGLGLAVAFAIVHAHGGPLRVTEGRRGGACFVFDLARSDEQVVPVPPPSGYGNPGERTLLLVEDDQAVRSIVEQRARRSGWRVIAVDSAERALEVLADGRLAAHEDRAAILCDLRMPGMGGWGLRTELERRYPTWIDRCLFFSGDLASVEAVDFARRIRHPLIGKPFDFGELFRLLDEVAGSETVPGASAGAASS